MVEGRYDKNTLSQLVDTVIVTTNGFGIFKDKAQLALLRRLAAERGLVILTDSDGAGFVIRNYLRGALPPAQVKHAYIPDLPGKERRKASPGREGKLGVEGMRPKADLFALGLSGGPGAAELRKRLLRELALPEHMSANALLAVVNGVLSPAELRAAVEKIF